MASEPGAASALPDPLPTPMPRAALDTAASVAVIELRAAGGLGVFLRVGDQPRLTRVAPVRDPRQPRFWCLAAFECSACGIPVSGDAIWAGFWGSPQSALSGLLETIRQDAAAWLAGSECATLRATMLQPRPAEPLPLARAQRRVPADRPGAPTETKHAS